MIEAAGPTRQQRLGFARATLKGWRDDPVRFVREALQATPERWQERALEALASHDRLAIRSGHGVGKSALLAWAILWWHVTRYPAKTACTAPTAHQLADVLWGELGKWHRTMLPPLAAEFVLRADRFELRGGVGQSVALARTARREQPEAFQGFHADHMLLIADEASGIDDIIFEAGQGAMSTAGAKCILTGNPTRTSGFFFDCFHKNRAHWHTLAVSCAESSLVAPAYAREMAANYGLESNIYRVRVLGEFPLSEDDVVIPLHMLEAAVGREVAPLKSVRPIWGVDVARYGADSSALARRKGNVLLGPVTRWRGKDTMQVAGLIHAAYIEAEEKPAEIVIDVIGIGAGVVDRLVELGLPARGVNVAEAAAFAERYARLRDELWFSARAWFEGLSSRLPEDDALIAELSGARYAFTSSGQLKVESKDEMKARGLRSPDTADAFCLTFAAPDQRLEPRGRERRTRRSGSWMSY